MLHFNFVMHPVTSSLVHTCIYSFSSSSSSTVLDETLQHLRPGVHGHPLWVWRHRLAAAHRQVDEGWRHGHSQWLFQDSGTLDPLDDPRLSMIIYSNPFKPFFPLFKCICLFYLLMNLFFFLNKVVSEIKCLKSGWYLIVFCFVLLLFV